MWNAFEHIKIKEIIKVLFKYNHIDNKNQINGNLVFTYIVKKQIK